MEKNLKGFVKRTKEKTTSEKDKLRIETVKFICDYFTSKGVTSLNFLTLPSAWWRFEKYIITRFRVAAKIDPTKINPYIKFIGCENDWVLYKLGCMWMPRTDISVMKVKTNNELNCQVVTNGYSHVFFNCDIFQYMQLIKDHKVKDDRKFDCIWLDTTTVITYIADKLQYLSNVLKDDSIVILTVIKGRETVKLPMERVEYINSLMAPLGLVLIKKHEYKDSSPMLQLMYQKVK